MAYVFILYPSEVRSLSARASDQHKGLSEYCQSQHLGVVASTPVLLTTRDGDKHRFWQAVGKSQQSGCWPITAATMQGPRQGCIVGKSLDRGVTPTWV